MSRGTWCLV